MSFATEEACDEKNWQIAMLRSTLARRRSATAADACAATSDKPGRGRDKLRLDRQTIPEPP